MTTTMTKNFHKTSAKMLKKHDNLLKIEAVCEKHADLFTYEPDLDTNVDYLKINVRGLELHVRVNIDTFAVQVHSSAHAWETLTPKHFALFVDISNLALNKE